ncbi:Ovule protein [Caenorhabditis elegans]|uniref:Ovule protein n=1 Tax=Caenorhabditis elegans TaxID=6239 RepID=Q9BKS9_CAEEL|nr:Ovule protein [Caenorhabditis elegans]CCD73041.1 Ovule protein [Caenorhabditis elegans]|eukprot:NP_497397.1 Uncharacterized protein CELE_Y82E9BR.10 [Caenorhabditis elegans]
MKKISQIMLINKNNKTLRKILHERYITNSLQNRIVEQTLSASAKTLLIFKKRTQFLNSLSLPLPIWCLFSCLNNILGTSPKSPRHFSFSTPHSKLTHT